MAPSPADLTLSEPGPGAARSPLPCAAGEGYQKDAAAPAVQPEPPAPSGRRRRSTSGAVAPPGRKRAVSGRGGPGTSRRLGRQCPETGPLKEQASPLRPPRALPRARMCGLWQFLKPSRPPHL
ncbi:uncharacterized protein LOC112392887 [Neophocaena asiaeorientalis asiaeorientalis]|uniref:Uncharacterized protein LOC112392887 n=1 Tax=Neophocaena asiaeorientalis asiaeorientalis TaxID=1706337 RepID=A0A341ALT6_NEOAA|nr:uncharacterized protein LOC112392887 [Neophocaena asiaeorientalis asiaeorientalis]